MKKENKKLDKLFDKFENQWDIETLESNHEERFIKKLKSKKPNWKRFVSIGIAASILVMLGLSIFNNTPKKTEELRFASRETKQTDSIFTILIENELEKIKEKKSPENEKIISDALKQMRTLDSDYEKIIKELETNGESKQIIYAMISNLQTRISFLQNVLLHIENNEKLKNISDEKTI
ncbi:MULTISPECIES: anti-sigma factor [Flavobacterium]|uniref:Anti-sigma factor n=1 Tax=Flavobacterium ranwuense TaxID=2541725 RepID=A0ABY2DMU4_9FLAO|nr:MULTISPECIES: anti-sigma factor [Flavobacterium]TDE27178.1 anti-sigma factor [Flavobacterium ranwuense]TDE49883.1 anti-sigma factor [Flavobacterium sp. GT3P67]